MANLSRTMPLSKQFLRRIIAVDLHLRNPDRRGLEVENLPEKIVTDRQREFAQSPRVAQLSTPCRIQNAWGRSINGLDAFMMPRIAVLSVSNIEMPSTDATLLASTSLGIT